MRQPSRSFAAQLATMVDWMATKGGGTALSLIDGVERSQGWTVIERECCVVFGRRGMKMKYLEAGGC
jgi:hypothetical protein